MMNNQKLILKKFQPDSEGILRDYNHKDIPFLDHEQSKIWIKIQEKSYWYKYRNNLIYFLLKKYSNNNNIADVGSGIGTTSLFLNKRGFNVESIEPSYTSCKISKDRGLKKIVNTTIFSNNLKIKDSTNILLLDVLEHIKNDDRFIKKLADISQNSRLFITVPAFKILWSHEDKHALHYRRYTIKGLKRILENNNFKILYSSYFFSYLFFPIFLFRALPYKINVKKRNKGKVNLSEYLPNKFLNIVLSVFERIELFFIYLKIKIPFGSSLIIIASKK